jgi:outer membrane protein OmpA-like peptidoglycan-associated protein
MTASLREGRGDGETQLLVPNDSDANRARDRRVERKQPGRGQ